MVWAWRGWGLGGGLEGRDVPKLPARERPSGPGPGEGAAAGAGPGQLSPGRLPPSCPRSREPSPYDESEVHDSFHQLIQEQSQCVAEEGLELRQRGLGAAAPGTSGEPSWPRRPAAAVGRALSLPGLSGHPSRLRAGPRWGPGGGGRWPAGTSGRVFFVYRQWPPGPRGARGCCCLQHGHAPHPGQHA